LAGPCKYIYARVKIQYHVAPTSRVANYVSTRLCNSLSTMSHFFAPKNDVKDKE